MATCPQCGGSLSSNHRCFGVWRYRARFGGVAIAGALMGLGLATLLSPAHPLPLSGVAAVLGALLTTAIWHEIR